MSNELLVWEDLQGSGRGIIEVLYRYLSKLQAGIPVVFRNEDLRKQI
jgi:hypothetical protein